MKRILLTLAGLLTIVISFSQGYYCDESDPFCTGTIYTFPAGTTGNAELGPQYNCLDTQPAPAWYHMRIEDPGNITIYMYSTPLVDIDFCCWGPFTDPFEPCPYGLTNQMVEDCSYSPAPQEYCDIIGAQTGEYYILLITNFSRIPCDITFSQTSGNGSTDCTILPPPVGNNGPLCTGDTLELYAAMVIGATYLWSGPNGFLSNLQNPVIYNVSAVHAGTYSCIITVGGQESDPATTSVVIYNNPTLSVISEDTLVCPGTEAYILVQLGGWGPFSVDYNDGVSEYTVTGLVGPVDTIFVFPPGPTSYTMETVYDLNCSRQLLAANFYSDTYPPASSSLSGSETICSGDQATLAFTLSGVPPWEVTYTQNGGNPQNFITSTTPHLINVNPSSTTLYQIEAASDQNCNATITGEALVTVEPTPVAQAGEDQTIPYGAFTTLPGQVSGGSGSYTYFWQPANKLNDPSVLQPVTLALTETTMFTLTADDNASGCQHSDQVLVTIEGGPLGCYPQADPPVICKGEYSQLQALASGGSGEYSYTWTSNPPGFNSNIPNPTVDPLQNTTYTVAVTDGFNLVAGNVTVIVRERPLPDAGNDITIPHGAYTTLNGSSSGGSGQYNYLWSPSDKLINPNMATPTTINLTTTTLFALTVTDAQSGCVSGTTDNMAVIISGDALAVNPSADPDRVCQGVPSTLYALAGGGTGNYTYQWTSSPPGFTSTMANPFVIPMKSTAYNVVVNDGFNLASGSVTVTVDSVPAVYLGPADTVVCVYDTLVLDAGNPGASYLWSNGSTGRYLEVGTTGIGFDMKHFSVTVTNGAFCETTRDITVYFDFSVCQGVGEELASRGFRVMPNPGTGHFRISFDEGLPGPVRDGAIYNIHGIKVMSLDRNLLVNPREELHLDLRHLIDGIYILRLFSDRHVYTGRIIMIK